MLDKLEFIETRYRELGDKISDPDIINDQKLWTSLMKEHASLTPIVEKYVEYKTAKEQLEENKKMLSEEGSDRELEEMIKEDIKMLESDIERLASEIKVLLLPKDPNDDKNVIMEIRGGVGGEEAALFAADLFRMYSMYASSVGWKLEPLSETLADAGGIKEIVFMVKGQGAYSKLKYETGVHRVQRVPTTESSGRIHTSAATVAVLPEVEDVEVEINPNDLKIDVFRAGGNGGQCVNTTDSAVRITHLPTGIVVSCQDEKSQLKNKEKGLKVLRSRIYEKLKNEQDKGIADERKNQVGSGDRSERIRTYNFPQGRLTDHRIGLTLYRLDTIMNGDIEEVIDSLITYYQSEKLKNEGLI